MAILGLSMTDEWPHSSLDFVTDSTDESSAVSDRIRAISDNLKIDPKLSYGDLKDEYLRVKYVGTKNSH